MKRASIFLRRGELFFDSESQTLDRFWVSTDEVLAVRVEDLDGIASGLKDALQKSRLGVKTPPPSTDLTGSLLAAAKVKTWSAFTRGAKCVSASLENGVVSLTPNRRIQASYEEIRGKDRAISLHSETLGQAVLDAMADATT
jgi:hypothetical protein